MQGAPVYSVLVREAPALYVQLRQLAPAHLSVSVLPYVSFQDFTEVCFQTLVYRMVTMRKLRSGYESFGGNTFLKNVGVHLHGVTNMRFIA